jgi:hypothetical protein
VLKKFGIAISEKAPMEKANPIAAMLAYSVIHLGSSFSVKKVWHSDIGESSHGPIKANYGANDIYHEQVMLCHNGIRMGVEEHTAIVCNGW